jgi:hypothetical protein
MLRFGSVCVFVLVATRAAWSAVSFAPVDVYIEAGGERLAAYQIEIAYDRGTTRIVGLEGGESAAFAAAPYYDPAGLAGGRVVLASFVARDGRGGEDVSAPSGRTRVARVHLYVDAADPDEALGAMTIRVITVADLDGRRFRAGAILAQTRASGKETE